jgi:ABC-2 type transport system ATP-binding protein
MLSVVNACKRFGNVVAVRDVSLTIGDGRTFGLLGPNGAGKTTMMRMILGIMAPDGGTIEWNGARVDEHVRLRFGYLPEERGLYGRMRVRDHIVYLGRLHGISKERAARAADEWIARLDLTQYAQRTCGELSKGNQQKVQVACAAVHAPDLLILDEPFTGLDPVNAGILLDVLADLQRRGTALVLSSHEMWQLERLCDEFCIIAQGAVRARGSLAELRRAWPSRRVRIAPPTPRVHATLEALPGAALVESNEGAVTYDLAPHTDCAELLRGLVATEAIVSFEQIEPSLRDVYLRVLGETQEA